MSSPSPLPPGFRFHPTDEELILHYLRNQAAALPCPVSIIAEVDIYKFDPWDLPAKAMFGEQEWYFFSPRDRKYPNGVRPNRAAASGYWKATGTDKPIVAAVGGTGNIGVKKALVFYRGRPPKGRKTNWIMHEYRLAEAHAGFNCKPMRFKNASMRLDDWVLCRIYKKNSKVELELPLSDQEQPSSPVVQKTHPVPDFSDDYSALPHLFDDFPELHKGSQVGLLIPQSGVNQLMADDNNISRNGSTNLVQLNHQPQLPALVDANPAQAFAELSSQVNDSQCNYLYTYLFNQKTLLNSHLGLHLTDNKLLSDD